MEEAGGHILVVASPLQGHAAPILKLSEKILKLGMQVTFLSMDIPNAEGGSSKKEGGMRVICVPSDPQGRGNNELLMARMRKAMPVYLEELLTGAQSPMEFSAVIIDVPSCWMIPIPKKLGFKTVVCWGSTPGGLALGFKIPFLLNSKFIDQDGDLLKENESFELIPGMPEMAATDLGWYFPTDKQKQKWMFHYIKRLIDHVAEADWIVGNWFHDLNPAASAVVPNILPVGPFLDEEGGDNGASFRATDSSCLGWLDAQPPRSVIYAAFGTTTRFTPTQLAELAAGLELTGRPFMWVAWPGLTEGKGKPYSEEFAERVADRGKIVEWAPQEAVLRHPATACFVTHCGWNSLTESLSRGVPVVCWPYFGDHIYSQRCACDGWKVGVRVEKDENGVVWRQEIKNKVEEIMCNHLFKDNAAGFANLAKQSLEEGGSSLSNLKFLLHQCRSSDSHHVNSPPP